jgi:uncharacterized protein YdhG (YjbR/CyaY superfamily)
MDKKAVNTIDDYIGQFSPDIQDRLRAVRNAIREAAPDAAEKISWQMPTFHQHGNVVHFAAFKDHISLFPGASGVEAFADRLSGFKTSKGTIQFPHGQPLPIELIKEVVQYRIAENIRLSQMKKQKTNKTVSPI